MRKVAVIMGSTSDLPVAEKAIQTLKEYGIETEVRVLSAHRCPNEAREFAASARESGFSCIIALAGMAAHLAGAMAANTTLPVIGVPCSGTKLDGMDALLSTVQMPSGIPVASRRYRRGEKRRHPCRPDHGCERRGLAHKLQAARDEGTAAVLKADEETSSATKTEKPSIHINQQKYKIKRRTVIMEKRKNSSTKARPRRFTPPKIPTSSSFPTRTTPPPLTAQRRVPSSARASSTTR